MGPYLLPLVLIGGLIVLGVLVGAGLVLLTVMRERHAVGVARDQATHSTNHHRAA